jgi:replication factor A1
MDESGATPPAAEPQSVETKIKDLNPQSKRVDVLAKCVDVGESREIPGKFGSTRRVAEATISDETAAVILSLWDDQIGTLAKDDVIEIKNGYVSLVRGHMRLNVGKYGTLSKGSKTIDAATTDPNMSDKEYEQERRSFGGGGGGGGRPRGGDSRGGGGGYGGRRDHSRDRGSSFGGGDDRPKYMNKGRRRF